MKKIIHVLTWTFLFCLNACFSIAQTEQDSTVYRVETKDGNEYTGPILYQDAEKIRIKTQNLGEVTILKADIVRETPVNVSRIKGGKYWFENPQAARYFWAPNGYGLQKGEAYYQNVWVMFNQASVGVTDNFSIGAGLIPLFLFAGTATPVWITPKFSVPVTKDKLNLGGGALVGTVVGEESGTGFGVLYGISTFGSRDKNVSLGLGYGYAGREWADTPLITVSTMLRMGARGYFLSENYYIDTGSGYAVLLSLGGRRIIKKAGLDYGLFIPIGSEVDSFFAIPWLGLTLPFGNTKASAPY